MENEMIERVASGMLGCPVQNLPNKEDRAYWRRNARAAIEAMREPSQVVISAGDACLPFTRGTETHKMAGGITPEGIWEAMIDAALCDHDWQENTEDEDVCSKCDASREPPSLPAHKE